MRMSQVMRGLVRALRIFHEATGTPARISTSGRAHVAENLRGHHHAAALSELQPPVGDGKSNHQRHRLRSVRRGDAAHVSGDPGEHLRDSVRQ